MTVSTGSMMNCIELKPLEAEKLNRFVRDNQEAFNFGALEEFGLRDNHFEEDEQIISRATIEMSVRDGEAYRIMQSGSRLEGLSSRSMAMRAKWSFCLFRRMLTAEESVTPPGVKWRDFIRKSGYGRLLHLILNKGISTFM